MLGEGARLANRPIRLEKAQQKEGTDAQVRRELFPSAAL